MLFLLEGKQYTTVAAGTQQYYTISSYNSPRAKEQTARHTLVPLELVLNVVSNNAPAANGTDMYREN